MSLLGDLGTAIKNKLGGTSVDNTVPIYNGTTCTLQGSSVTISDTNVVTASGGFVGSLTGNASTATKLQTARTINGVAFDGTANITVSDSTAVKLTDNQTIAGVKTFSSTIVGSINGNASTANKVIAIDNTIIKPADVTSRTLAHYFTSQGGLTATTPDINYGDLIALNGYSDASGGLVNGLFLHKNSKRILHYQAVMGATTWGTPHEIAYTTDNVASATKLATARTINGVAFDGSANITVSDDTAVKLTGNQTIAGVKTFSSSPIVPTPTVGNQAANKQYVDDFSNSISPVIISGQVGAQSNVPIGKIPFGEIWVNTGGISYNSTTRRFTVPKSGTYRITMNPFKSAGAASARVLVGINTDTPTAGAHKGHTYANGTVYSTMNINSVVNLSANDYIVFYLSEGELYNASNDSFNQFTIERIA